MHSRLNIPAPARVKTGDDAERKVTRQSNAELRLRPKRITGQSAEKSLHVVPLVARTVNRHRWVSVSSTQARERNLSKELGTLAP